MKEIFEVHNLPGNDCPEEGFCPFNVAISIATNPGIHTDLNTPQRFLSENPDIVTEVQPSKKEPDSAFCAACTRCAARVLVSLRVPTAS